jgi:hypothetical protein
MKQGRYLFLAWLLAAFLLTLLWQAHQPVQAAPHHEVAFADQRLGLQAGVQWLMSTHQNSDGGFTSFSSGANQAPSNVAGTLDAVLAIASAGYNPAANYPSQPSNPITFLETHPISLTQYAAGDGGNAGKLLLALTSASQNPADFAGYNFVITLTDHLSPTGQYNTSEAYRQSLAMLGLASVHETIPVTATQWLIDQQEPTGAWDDGFGTADSIDSTAMAIMALVAADVPVTHTALVSATAFLASSQDTVSGGWAYSASFGEPNANSTALAVQALVALGEDFYSSNSPWAQAAGEHTPLRALQGFQTASGAFQADFGSGPFDDFFSTTQALPALTGKAYPLPGRWQSAYQALSCLADLQDQETGGWEQFATFGVNAAGTSRAIQAIAAVGDDPQSTAWTTITGTNAVEALENLTPAYLASGRGGRAGIVTQGVVAAGAPYAPTNFAGYNLPLTITGYLSPTGEYDQTGFGPVAHSEAMLGLLAAGFTPDSSANQWLLQAQQANGGWGGADSTGIVLQVLGWQGLSHPAGVANLMGNQLPDAGWGFGGVANPSSSSEVVQGLVWQHQNPFDPAWSEVVSGTVTNVADTIMAQQQADGCWPNLFGPGADPFGTTDAILLLTQRPGWSVKSQHIYLPLIVRE